MEHTRKFNEQNYEDSIVDYIAIGEIFRERKVNKENFDELPIILQICNTRPLATATYMHA